MENDHLSSIWCKEAVLLDFDFWKDKIFFIGMKPSLLTEIKVFVPGITQLRKEIPPLTYSMLPVKDYYNFKP